MKQWFLTLRPRHGFICVAGLITDDQKSDRGFKNDFSYSSPIVKLDLANNICETENTIYKLEDFKDLYNGSKYEQ